MGTAATAANATILAYHHVCDRWHPSIARVTPSSFKTQLNHIVRSGFVTPTLSEFFLSENRKGSATSAALLTFDDGLSCFYNNALPFLLDRSTKATIFVVTDFIGKKCGWDYYSLGNACRHMDWNQLRELVSLGFEIGSHSCSHLDLKSVKVELAKREMVRSKAVLEEKLGVPVNFFSYPFGRANSRLESFCCESNYLGAVSMLPGRVNGNRFSLNRNAVYLFEGDRQFRSKLCVDKYSKWESIKLKAINYFSIATVILKNINKKALAS